MKCAVLNCDNNTLKETKEYSFFSFPKNEKLSKQWQEFCGNPQKINTQTALICSVHFKADDIVGGLAFEMGMCSRRRLWPGAMPCMHKTPATEATVGRRKRREKTEHSNKRLMLEVLAEPTNDVTSDPLEENESEAEYTREEDEQYEEVEQQTAEDKHYEQEQQSQNSSTIIFPKSDERHVDDFLDVESSEAVIDELTNQNESLRMENMRHKVNIQLMQKKHKREVKEYAHKLERAKFHNKQLETQLETFFTPEQIHQMRNNIDKLWIKKCRYVRQTMERE